ncbi:YheC/YheD family protein [Paenibacillus kobensis]|uniref:YheC/YheD family protein n=1 Tax=Paenibacillus kobensis TaxID=59841 RepID=UPI000FD94F8A|nr:YheC/YheD family protein [Paenibacillus kobensis]
MKAWVSRSIPFVNKIKVTKWMRGGKSTRSAIPEAGRLTKQSLDNMLNQYRMVYVKPSSGQKGQGVMRVRKAGDEYEFRYKRINKKTATVDELHGLIQKYKVGGRYMVQQGIRMMKYKGSSFDLRMLVQRKGTKKSWVITGKFARVAAKGKIVTNVAQGAAVHTVPSVLRANFSKKDARSMAQQVEEQVLRIARRYAKLIPQCIELGVDIAIDREQQIWMLELNTKPGIYPFLYLKDKSMYRKILEYRRAK